jgi:hypothetical protein
LLKDAAGGRISHPLVEQEIGAGLVAQVTGLVPLLAL